MENLFIANINHHSAKALLEYDLNSLAGGVIYINGFLPYRPNDFTYCVHKIEFLEKTKTLILSIGAFGYPNDADVLELKNPTNISIQNNLFTIKKASEIVWKGNKVVFNSNESAFVLEIS
jgi:hypothetical protein